jgi:3-oxoadipate enol-lactonase
MQITSNGSTFHCRIDGDSGPWVMFSHGLATDLTMWDELAAALKGRYRVLRYDARGHGESAATEGDYSLDMLVADAAGILDALDITQTHFVGLSMGGMVAQGLLLDHPHRMTSAVIADSRHTTTPEFTQAWLDRIAVMHEGGIEAIVASTVERSSSAGLARRKPAIVARMERMIRNTSPDGYCGCAAAPLRWRG